MSGRPAVPYVRPSTGRIEPSRSDVMYQNSGNVLYLRQHKAAQFAAWMPDVCAAYLRSRFDTPEALAAACNVRMSTAYNWWSGLNAPSGAPLLRLMLADPGFRDFFQAAWNERGAA